MFNHKKLRSLVKKRTVSPNASVNGESAKSAAKAGLSFSKRAKVAVAFVIIAILLISTFAFLSKGNEPPTPQPTNTPTITPTSNSTFSPTPQITPTTKPSSTLNEVTKFFNNWIPSIETTPAPKPPGIIEAAGRMNSSVWREVAANAWRYFQPGIGVDSTTGLPGSGDDWPNFTDWDLGVYIQAVIDAQKIGLISKDDPNWGSNMRLEKVVSFLETRQLNKYGYPYWFYTSTGQPNVDTKGEVDGVDTGRLFVALNNLRTFEPSFANRIKAIVVGPGNRSNYASLVPGVYEESTYSTSIYAYYIASGFESFWPTELAGASNRILSNIAAAGTVSTYNATLPLATILGDPLLCSVFELSSKAQLMKITNQTYTAHEAYYNATGIYRAFSEGGSLSDHWAYEWVVLPDGRTWVVFDENNNYYGISPIIYTKIAIGFLAIYNTTFAYNMTVHLERNLPDPVRGYSEGMDESGQLLTGTGLNTNGLILGAAKYAIQRNP